MNIGLVCCICSHKIRSHIMVIALAVMELPQEATLAWQLMASYTETTVPAS